MMKLKWIGSLLILAGVVGCKTPDRPNLVEYVRLSRSVQCYGGFKVCGYDDKRTGLCLGTCT